MSRKQSLATATVIPRRKSAVRRITQLVILFGLWLTCSGIFVAEFLVIGFLTSLAGIILSEKLFRDSHEGRFAATPKSFAWLFRASFHFVTYLPWLAYEIVLSNIHVAYLILHPRIPVDSTLVAFETTLTSEPAQVALAQSITLTPGTVTVDASGGTFLIHCLSASTRRGIADGILQRRIAKIFEEPAATAVELRDILEPSQVSL